MIKILLVVFTGADLFIDLSSDFSWALSLLLDELEDIKLLESLGSLELLNDFSLLFIRVVAATWSDKQNSWLNIGGQLLKSLIKVLRAVDKSKAI